MKREFGAKLIEDFLPTKDLRLVADTSGANIPGHSTPTVIIVGLNRRPSTPTVRALLGIRGEPGRPTEPEKGKVWSTVVAHVDEPGWSDEWVSVTDLDRSLLASHPWSLTGGGAVQLKEHLEQVSAGALSDLLADSGALILTRADPVFVDETQSVWLERLNIRAYVLGEDVRDWHVMTSARIIFPYGEDLEAFATDAQQQYLWPWKFLLQDRVAFGKNQIERGLPWYGFSMFFKNRLHELAVRFSDIATHLHVARAGQVLSSSHAPSLVFDTDEHLISALGLLNSSTACFWVKQNSHSKGNATAASGIPDQPWSWNWEFAGKTLQGYPLPKELPLARGRSLEALAHRLGEHSPSAVIARGVPTRGVLDTARENHAAIRAQMVAQQEELDWETYWHYGLIDEHLTASGDEIPALFPAERAFAIVLARAVQDGAETSWFDHWNHRYQPVMEPPTDWPEGYRCLVQRRIDVIESHPFIKLLERPEYKRRWATESWEKQEERALRGWLLDRLEDRRFWFDGQGRPTPKSVAQLADEVWRDEEITSVLGLWEGRPDVPVRTSLEKLLAKEGVPYLAAYRYKDSGLRKRPAWEHAWDLLRREDAGAYNPAPKDRGGDGPIPVPPKYTSADFTRTEYWSHRGKLDVPKERFILYPDAGRETDPTPVLGWAGWDHAEQALALATLIQARESEGWAEERLVPLVAGLAEVLPWVRQWHAEPEALYGGVSPAEFFAEQLDTRAKQLGKTIDELQAWRPAPARRGRRKATT